MRFFRVAAASVGLGFTEDRIANNIFTERALKEYSFKFFNDKVRAITWLSAAFKSVLHVDQYIEEIQGKGTREHTFIKRILNIVKFQPETPFDICKNPSRDSECSPVYLITCKNLDDATAIHNLKIILSRFLLSQHSGYQSLYKPDKSALTLMCINKFHRNSLFGQLPKDVAIKIAKKAHEENRLDAPVPKN